MTFDARHYVPVLKVKRGEKRALRLLSDDVRRRVTPLLEIVERKEERAATIEKHLGTAFKDLAESVSPFARCFLDVREIEADGPPAATSVFERAAAEGIVFTPVTGISRSVDVEAALRHRAHGLALRLTRSEVESGSLTAKLREFMAAHGLSAPGIDLIVDLGPVDDLVAEGIRAMTDTSLACVPDQLSWRTLTLSGCAFPPSMGVVDRQSHASVERTEWIAWRDFLHARRSELVRLPTYSDCAIQHPRGVEGFDPRLMQVSASVRYAVPDSWLLIKGESTRTTPPSIQFPGLATQLVYGHLKPHFRGAHHCEGCEGIQAAADGAKGFGSAEVWRRLGTVHHISTVAQSLAALPWS